MRWRWKRRSEGELPKLGAVNVPPTVEYGVAVGMVDCGGCLVEDNLAALVSKIAQTDEGMGKEGMTVDPQVPGRG